MFRKLNGKAISLGIVAAISSYVFFSFSIVFVISHINFISASKDPLWSKGLWFLLMLPSLMASILSGHITYRNAKDSPIINTACLAVVLFFLNQVTYFVHPPIGTGPAFSRLLFENAVLGIGVFMGGGLAQIFPQRWQFNIPVIIYRLLYLTLVMLACIGRYFDLRPPFDGAEPGPGDSFMVLLDIFLMTFVGLPIYILVWAKGFSDVHFRKLILSIGIISVELPVFLALISLCKVTMISLHLF